DVKALNTAIDNAQKPKVDNTADAKVASATTHTAHATHAHTKPAAPDTATQTAQNTTTTAPNPLTATTSTATTQTATATAPTTTMPPELTQMLSAFFSVTAFKGIAQIGENLPTGLLQELASNIGLKAANPSKMYDEIGGTFKPLTDGLDKGLN